MVTDDVDNLLIEQLLLLLLLSSQSVCLLERVENLMMKIHFLLELGHYFVIHFLNNFCLQFIHLEIVFKLVDHAIAIQIIFGGVIHIVLRSIILIYFLPQIL